MAPTVLSARAMGYPAADKNRVLVRHDVCGPVQIRKNPAAGRTSKPRGQETDMEVAFIARGIPAPYPCGGRGAVSRNHYWDVLLGRIRIHPLRPVFSVNVIVWWRWINIQPAHVSKDSQGLRDGIHEVVMPDFREGA